MIKVSDFIAEYLKDFGIENVFMLTGGGAMHLNNSLGKYLNYICFHHEQACAIAAEGFSRTTGKLSVVNVTTGPGGLNTLTGVLGQWTDSVPVLYISGQVKISTTIDSCLNIKLRQLGDQEVDIVSVVKPITKYAHMVKNANDIKYYLKKAIYIAMHGRPGPVWLDIPIDVQSANIDENAIKDYSVREDEIIFDESHEKINEVINLINHAKRPVIVAGNGIHISQAEKEFRNLLQKLKIPVVTTFNGFDLLEEDHELNIGRIGVQGTRTGNFSIQNADLLIEIGTRNNIRQVSYNWENFGKNAKKIIVDIDNNELLKKTIIPDLSINMDAKEFINSLAAKTTRIQNQYSEWISWCNERKIKYPVVLKNYKNSTDGVHPYYLIDILTNISTSNDTFISGNGTVSVVMMQAAKVKKNQRLFGNSGCAAMGYDLPASIGAALGIKKGQIICLAGDGSFQMNIQELQTLKYHNLPIKIFYFNNNGYHSIRQTQNNFFNGEIIGCDSSSKVSFPDMIKIAKAYGLNTMKIDTTDEIELKIKKILGMKKPVFCEVKITQDYIFAPKVASKKLTDGSMVSSSLEDMSPFLDEREMKMNTITD